MRVYVDALACEQRQLGFQKVINYLDENKIERVSSPSLGDFSIFIACAVDDSNKSASLSRIEEIVSQMGGKGKLIVGGCLPSIDPEGLSKYDPYATFSPRSLDVLDDIFKPIVPISRMDEPHCSDFDSPSRIDEEVSLSSREEYDLSKQGFKIKIDEGCLLNCSYCAIKKATGDLSSKPLEEVLEEFRKAVSQKESRVMLMGGDTGAYGYDIGLRLPNLLEEISAISQDPLIFVHDLNVNWLIKDFPKYLTVFKENEDRGNLKALNFPIQSGSDRILSLMRRPYNVQKVRDVFADIKKYSPSLKIGTHMIVGFPTETEEDFDMTLRLLEDINFDFLTCFSYSESKGVKSSKIPNKVDLSVIKQRLDRLSNIFKDKVKVVC